MTDIRHRPSQRLVRRASTRPGLTLLCAAALGACGNVTAGGFGEAEVYMSGDAEGGQPTAVGTTRSSAVGGAEEGSVPPPVQQIVGAGLQGDVEVTASFFLGRGGGSLVQLTPDGDVTVSSDLGGMQAPKAADQVVPADSYGEVVVVFTEVTAHVTGGLEIDGVPFAGSVTVDLGSGGLDVTRAVAIVIEEGGLAEVLVDLNADGWIPLLDVLTPTTGTVAAEDFAAAVTITER
jgi:hypothetical protein